MACIRFAARREVSTPKAIARYRDLTITSLKARVSSIPKPDFRGPIDAGSDPLEALLTACAVSERHEVASGLLELPYLRVLAGNPIDRDGIGGVHA